MKNLVIIRHAKSSWDDPALADLERPLNTRGKRDAPIMGQVLRDRAPPPDLIIGSPAKRARKTARLIAAAVGYPEERITIDRHLYMQGVTALLNAISGLPEPAHTVFLVGHNPDLTTLVSTLTEEDIGTLPTCGVASVEFAVETWAAAGPGVGRLMFFDYPKRHRPAAKAPAQ